MIFTCSKHVNCSSRIELYPGMVFKTLHDYTQIHSSQTVPFTHIKTSKYSDTFSYVLCVWNSLSHQFCILKFNLQRTLLLIFLNRPYFINILPSGNNHILTILCCEWHASLFFLTILFAATWQLHFIAPTLPLDSALGGIHMFPHTISTASFWG